MIDSELERFPNVEIVDNLILVGEKHLCPESGRLASRICEGLDPVAFGVENSPAYRQGKTSHITTRSGAIEYLEGYSSTRDVPLFYLDIPTEQFEESLLEAIPDDMTQFEAKQISNQFEDPIDDSGKVTYRSISAARERVREQINEETYEFLYDEREEYIVKQLNWMRNEFSDPVVVAVGAFHVPALVKNLESSTTSMSPKDLQ